MVQAVREERAALVPVAATAAIPFFTRLPRMAAPAAEHIVPWMERPTGMLPGVVVAVRSKQRQAGLAVLMEMREEMQLLLGAPVVVAVAREVQEAMGWQVP